MNEQCPRCGSFQTQEASKFAVFTLLLGTGSCLIWLGFIIAPLWILAAAFIIASPFGFLISRMTVCKNCKYTWKTGKVEEYKKAIQEKSAAIESDDILEPENESTLPSNEKSSSIESDDPKQIDNIKVETKPLINKHITFRVAGVTSKNEKGQDIQNIIKRVANSYKREYMLESFDGYSNSEILEYFMDMTEFEGQYIDDIIELVPEPDNQYDKNAIKVYITDASDRKYHIGYVKKAENVKLLHELENNKIRTTSVEFLGGKVKHVDYDWEKEKDIVVSDEITRGVEVTVYFENEIK